MGPLVWVGLGLVAGIGLCAIVVLGLFPRWIANAEVGVDPFAGLPGFDEDEAQELLDAGA